MLRNYIKIALRNLLKNKSHTAINIAGLSIGICSAIVIYFIVSFDLSFDNYHDDTDRIYRLVQHETTSGELEFNAGIPYPLRFEFQNEYPEVEALALVDQNSGSLIHIIQNGEKKRFENEDVDVAFTMPSFFEIFKYEFLLGEASSLAEENNVILSQRVATLYFGDYESALGKVINYENSVDLTVTGIVKNPPPNTDIGHEIFIAFETGASERTWDSWTATSTSVQAFIKVMPAADIADLKEKVLDYIQVRKDDGNATTKALHLQPISEMHHNAQYGNLSGRIASYEEINTLVIIGFLLLIAACINFINLNTALAVKRAKEIGIRKVMGSGRRDIIVQYLGETTLITFIALGISLGLAELLQINLEALIGFSIPVFQYDFQLILFLLTLFVGVTLLSGLYPALILSGYQPIRALKSNVAQGTWKGEFFRKGLIVFQLLVAQSLVIAVIVVVQQLDHFLNTPNGFNSDAIVQFNVPRPAEADLNLLTERIKQIDNVSEVSFSSTGTASNNQWGANLRFDHNGEEKIRNFEVKIIDEHFLNTYKIPMISGLNVKEDTIRRYLLNETGVAELGLNDTNEIIGQRVSAWGTEGEVIGVVKDFKTISLHQGQQPVVLWYDPSMLYLGSVKLGNGNHPQTMEKVEAEWKQFFSDYTFSYSYLDENIEQFYVNESRMAKIFSLFAGVAIFIGAIGLLGLVSHAVNQKTKEIGVRKVLGASFSQIVYLLSSDFVKLVIGAFIVAAPISWFFMNTWLQDFASRITISPLVFVGGLLFTLTITLIIISFKSIKAALINPVNVLKDD